MTCEELQTILESWEAETREEQGDAEEEYEYNRGKLAAFKMIVELLQKKKKNDG